MKDWTDAFKEKMINDRRPLPEGELEMLERIISRRERGKRIRRMAYISSAAFAAAYALIVFLPITKNTHEGNELVGIEAAGGTKIVLAETVEDNNEPINPSTIKTAFKIKKDTVNSTTVNLVNDISEVETTEDVTTEDITDIPSSPLHDQSISRAIGWFPPESNLTDRKEKRWSVSVASGGYTISPSDFLLYPNSPKELTGIIPNNNGFQTAFHHSSPITMGISIGYRINDQFTLVSGGDYAVCRSEITDKRYDSITIQKAHYLGIPLHLDWTPLSNERFSLYVGAGAEAWSCFYAKQEDKSIKDNTIYLSTICLGGVKYEPVRNVALFVQPQYSHTFLPERNDPDAYLHTAISDDPDLFTVKVGLSFSFD